MAYVEEIKQELKFYFKIKGKITIDPLTGVVDVSRHVELTKEVKQLPVSFGKVGGDFSCYINQLTSLAGAPSSVGGGFYCTTNQLTSLEGAPTNVGGDFSCSYNKLVSLAGAPSNVGGNFYLDYNPELPLLRTLVAKKITCVNAPDSVNDILNRYADQGNKGVLLAAAELIKAGYRDNARL